MGFYIRFEDKIKLAYIADPDAIKVIAIHGKMYCKNLEFKE